MPEPVMRTPPEDPFDHSHCYHERPRWIMDISPNFRVDLLEIMHYIWKLLHYGNVRAAVAMLEELNSYLVLSSLGMQDDIEQHLSKMEKVDTDLQTLRNDKAFTDELKKLFEKDQNGATGDNRERDNEEGGDPPNGPLANDGY